MKGRLSRGLVGLVGVCALWSCAFEAQGSEGPVFVSKWGREGTDNGEFRSPWHVAVDASRNVYVSDSVNHRIQKFTSEGVFLTKWGKYGSGDGEFNYPADIAFDSSGNVYVSDHWNYRIQVFTPDGVFLRKWGSEGSGPGQFARPDGIDFDDSGNLYVADWGNHRIQKFTSEGVFLKTWGAEGSGPGQFKNPQGVAVGKSGNVYVADKENHRIQKFTSEGVFLTAWGEYGSGPGQFKNPQGGVAVDNSGNVYVACVGKHTIQKFTSEGVFVTEWGSEGSGDGEFVNPHGVDVDNRGYVFVTDHSNHRIQKFAFRTTWHVDDDALSDPAPGDPSVSDPLEDGSQAHPFDLIQEGIDAASDGGTVIVAEGTYVENIHFHGKNIILQSTDTLDLDVVAKTIIDGNRSGSVVTFSGTERPTCVLSGFTIRNGEAEFGGGVWNGTWESTTRATIANNSITRNQALHGAGIYGCGGPIYNNVITENSAEESGGGVQACDGSVMGNLIAGNEVGNFAGGGVCACRGNVVGNVIAHNDGGTFGGGVDSCHGTVANNIVVGNRANSDGGGIYACSGVVSGNIIASNSVGYVGGGSAGCRGLIHNNIIVGNWALEGGGAISDCDGLLLNNTIVWNQADIAGKGSGGIEGCTGAIVNCIIWGNPGPDEAQVQDSIAPSASCIQHWSGGGEGNTAEDPLFAGFPSATGHWTGLATFNGKTWQTTLVDSGADWVPDALIGMFVNPDVTQPHQYPVAFNTSTTITVWGDASLIVHGGDAYEIYDYHLRPDSPCVDAGDNTVDVARFDLDGDYRRICTRGKPGWSGVVDYVVKDEGGAVTLIWKGFIDMGAYECQVFGDVPETFTISTSERMESGDWIEFFTGNISTWTDSDATGMQKFYRVEMK